MLEEMLRGGNRGIVGFDPTTIPGCTVWFDAADPATFGLSGTSLQTWRSKGSASCTASFTYNAPIVSTISGLSSIYFNGVSTMMNTNRIASYGATETTWITCAVNLATVSASTPADACPVIATQGAGAERSIRYTCNVNATAYTINTSVLRQTTGDNTNGVRGFIDTAAYFAGFTNGTMITSNTTAVTFQPGYNQSFVMGQWNIGWLYGYVYEILIYNRALSLGEYQSVEGYLSQKWGFSPAKVFTPLSIPGCSLWLDGADASRTSGITSGNWLDKSGLGNTATSNAGGAAFSMGTINGLPAVTFPSGSATAFIAQTPITLSSTVGFSIFFVARWTSASPDRARFFCTQFSAGGTLDIELFADPANTIPTTGCLYGGTTTNGNGLFGITLPSNTPFVYSTVFTSTSSYSHWLNGITGGTQTPFGGGTVNGMVIGNYTYPAAAYAFIGQMGEFIVYNAALTTAQRQAVEGYLAWKWGLQGSLALTHPNYLTTANFVRSLTLATTHPFYSQMPMTRAFTPIDIPGCTLWLDGADTSSASMILSGINVTQWSDKSGSGNHATGGVSPTYSSSAGAVLFNGTSSYLQTSISAVPTVETVFAVFRTTILPTQTNAGAVIFGSTANGGRGFIVVTNLTSGSTDYNLRYDSYFVGNIFLTPYGGVIYNTLTLATGQYTGGQGAGSTNGSNFGSFQSLSFSGAGTTRIGAVSGGGFFNGTINEILIYNNALGAAQRQAVEGYLANKWGIKASMPVFANPRSIPGCAMWFDGNDPAGTGITPANGAGLSTWVNKGTGTISLTYSGTQPTYITNYRNGLGSVSFNLGYFIGSHSFNLAVKSAFLVVTQDPSTTFASFVSFHGSGGDAVNSINGYSYQGSESGIGSFGWLYNIFQSGSINTPSPTFGYYIRTGSAGVATPFGIYGNVMSNQFEQTFVNGTAHSNFTITTTPGTATNFMIGGRAINNNLQAEFVGKISEVIVYNTALTSNQRQQVEGYLAWKWGLQTSLLATHPFYATVPVPHPFNKVPPTIRQPALPYDVTPGNWAQDWQPYVRALTRANAGATASFSSSLVTGSGGGYLGGVLAPNGKIYCIPRNAVAFGVIDPIANTFTTFGPTATNSAYIGGVLAPNGKIYCIPASATAVHVIDPTNDSVSTNSVSGTAPGNNAYGGGVLATNGRIYCVPFLATSIGIIDPIAGTFSTTAFPAGTITGAGAGNYAYEGGVLAPNGKIYLIPVMATSVGVIDTDTNRFSTTLVSGTSSGNYAYIGGVLAPNGKIYCLPHGATTVGLIDPVANTFTTFGTAPGEYLYQSGVLGPDGKIYSIPTGATSIAVIDTAVNTYTTFGTATGYIGGILAPNGKIYCIPLGSTAVGVISFSGLNQLPSLNYCLSAYANKL